MRDLSHKNECLFFIQYFEEILNRNVEEDELVVQKENQEVEEGLKWTEASTGQGIWNMKINIDTPTLEEVKMAIKHLKNRRAPGIDNIPPVVVDTRAKLLHSFMVKI